jgi:hypothetical protein
MIQSRRKLWEPFKGCISTKEAFKGRGKGWKTRKKRSTTIQRLQTTRKRRKCSKS